LTAPQRCRRWLRRTNVAPGGGTVPPPLPRAGRLCVEPRFILQRFPALCNQGPLLAHFVQRSAPVAYRRPRMMARTRRRPMPTTIRPGVGVGSSHGVVEVLPGERCCSCRSWTEQMQRETTARSTHRRRPWQGRSAVAPLTSGRVDGSLAAPQMALLEQRCENRCTPPESPAQHSAFAGCLPAFRDGPGGLEGGPRGVHRAS